MSDDLVEQLGNVRCEGIEEMCWEAAARITALTAERDALAGCSRRLTLGGFGPPPLPRETDMTADELKSVLADHALWVRGEGGKRANLAGADFEGADFAGANLAGADFEGADFEGADFEGANLAGAYLARANLTGANLAGADFEGADFEGANLAGANLARAYLARAYLARANLTGANLDYCTGNMREIRSIQIDTWAVTYTADTLQIGCQRHPIDKWRKWDTDASRKWIAQMDSKAADWAERNLPMIFAIIDANPATKTGHEAPILTTGN